MRKFLIAIFTLVVTPLLFGQSHKSQVHHSTTSTTSAKHKQAHSSVAPTGRATTTPVARNQRDLTKIEATSVPSHGSANHSPAPRQASDEQPRGSTKSSEFKYQRSPNTADVGRNTPRSRIDRTAKHP
jgi:hypothetical protein